MNYNIYNFSSREKLGLLTVLTMVAYSAGYFIESVPTYFWKVVLIVLCLYSIMSHKLNNIEKAVLLFLSIDFLYYIIAASSVGSAPRITTIAETITAFSSLYIFTYINYEEKLSEKFITIASILLLIAGMIGYWSEKLLMTRALLVDSNEDVTLNSSASFLYLLPLLFYVKNRWLAISELIVCLLYIFSASKRGVIVACVLPTILLVFTQFKNNNRNILRQVSFLALIAAAYVYLKQKVLDNTYLIDRYEHTLEGDSSGRDEIYQGAYKIWDNSNFTDELFGHGYDATLSLLGIHAHNDWLELLVDLGLVGVCAYALIFFFLYKCYKQISEKRDKFVFISCVTIWLIKSITSMGFLDSYLMILMIPLVLSISNNKTNIQTM